MTKLKRTMTKCKRTMTKHPMNDDTTMTLEGKNTQKDIFFIFEL